MPGVVVLVLIAAAVAAWSVVLDVTAHSSERFASFLVRVCGERWAGLRSFLVSLAALAAYVVVHTVAVEALGDGPGALVVVLPAVLVYAPFAFVTVPGKFTLYAPWRADLEAAGADPATARRIAWWGGPVALAGMVVLCVTVVRLVLD